MSKFGFFLALAGFVFALAGFIVWEVDSGAANSARNLAAYSQASNTANIALGVGILGVIVGIFGLYIALRGS